MKKKLLAFALAVGMVLTTAISCFADNTITCDDPQYFNTYKQPLIDNEKYAKSENFRRKYFDKFDNEVIIAVIDTGFGNSNVIARYFDGRLLPGYNVTDGSTDTSDPEDHGTHVATVALHNSTKNVKIMPIKGGNKVGIPFVKAMRYAIDHGADIINCSFVEPSATDKTMSDDVKNILKEARDKNILVVCGAGNTTGTSIGYPAINKNTIAVSELRMKDGIIQFIGGSKGKEMDFSALTFGVYPVNVITKDQDGNIIEGSHEGVIGGAGTSIASPMVAGCFAMLKSLHPDYTWDQLYDLAVRLSDDCNEGDHQINGWDEYTGWGQICMDKLLCDHTFKKGEKVEATCEHGSYTKNVCTKCGYWERLNEGEPLGHHLVRDDSWCMVCDRCGEEFDHEWEIYDGTDPDKCRKCKLCGEEREHGFSKQTVLFEGSHRSTGKQKWECGFCGYSKLVNVSSKDVCESMHLGDFVEKYKADPGAYPDYTYQKMLDDNQTIETYTVKAQEVIDHLSEYEDVAATCTKKGKEYYVCPICYRVTSFPTFPLKHEYLDENKITVEPTCTEAGYTKNTCTRCGEEVREETSAALGHDFDDGVVTTEATCTTDGVKTYTCKRCNEVKEEAIKATGHQHTTIINKTSEYTGDTYCEDCDTIIEYGTTLDHVWDEENVEVTEPTCTETGKKVYHCTNEGCTETKEEVIPATGHQNTKTINKKEATCTENGYSGDTYCNDCGQVIKTGETTPMKDHNYKTEVDRLEPTCAEAGYVTYKCTNCDATKNETLDKTNEHTEGERINEKPATCTEDGYTGDIYCTVCNTLLEQGEKIQATGHQYVVKTSTPATCTKGGQIVYTCEVCADEKTEDTPATGHKSTYVSGKKDATCTEEGYTGDTVCSDCGQTVKKGSVIGKTAHKSVTRNAKAATCTSTGYTGDTYCSVCNTKLSSGKTTPALGHKNVVKNARSATCTSAGYTGDTYCSVCGTKISSGKATNALGHSFGGWYVTRNATAVAEGEQARNCTRCGARETTIIGRLAATGNLNANSFPLKVKQSVRLTVNNMAAGDYVVSWVTSDKNKATVDGSGKVTGKKKGAVTITCRLASGHTMTARVNVQTGQVKTKSITVNTRNITLRRGQKFRLLAAKAPFTSQQGISYSSKKGKIATVSKTGWITAKSVGTTNIYVKSGSKKVTVKVTVQGVPTSELRSNQPGQVTVKKGKSLTWKVTKVPANSSDKVTYTSSNKKIATVNKSGKVTGKKKGTVTITAKAGNKKIYLKVTVQ